MTYYDTLRAEAKAFAEKIRALGFKVAIAGGAGSSNGLYGYITDDTGSRVMCWSVRDGTLTGNYGPPSTSSGTGWQLEQSMGSLVTADDVRAALYAGVPTWVGRGWKYLTTEAQYLGLYQSSSRFEGA